MITVIKHVFLHFIYKITLIVETYKDKIYVLISVNSIFQVASRIAEERGSILGGEIGYTIRFEDCSEEAVTKVKVCSPKLILILTISKRSRKNSKVPIMVRMGKYFKILLY